jgi:hypothetical protein
MPFCCSLINRKQTLSPGEFFMISAYLRQFLFLVVFALSLAGPGLAQSSRPRRVKQPPPPPAKPAEDPLLRPEPKQSPSARNNSNSPLLDVQPVKPVSNAVASTETSTVVGPVSSTVATADTSHAYQLLQQKQFAEAAKEARTIAVKFPN